ncbi:hypothetical protein ACN4EK_28030 [Pantanalinema rosaneae CENA516]|uniref:hypothetical protein n=1 Tax=Pantanalinema rosaneae TaxID=1620701 RepID=UPI003D6E596C
MKPQAYLLATASLVTLALLGASSFQAASQQMFRNQTARVGMMTTMKLLNLRSRPVSLSSPTAQRVTAATPSVRLLQSTSSFGWNQRFSLDHSLNQVEQMTDALLTLKKLSTQGQVASNQPLVFGVTETQLQTAQEVTWLNFGERPLQHPNYHLQTLDLDLPQAQSARGSQPTLDTTAHLQFSKEVKPLLNSPKMADQ